MNRRSSFGRFFSYSPLVYLRPLPAFLFVVTFFVGIFLPDPGLMGLSTKLMVSMVAVIAACLFIGPMFSERIFKFMYNDIAWEFRNRVMFVFQSYGFGLVLVFLSVAVFLKNSSV